VAQTSKGALNLRRAVNEAAVGRRILKVIDLIRRGGVKRWDQFSQRDALVLLAQNYHGADAGLPLGTEWKDRGESDKDHSQ
jgi:hypothetical protein